MQGINFIFLIAILILSNISSRILTDLIISLSRHSTTKKQMSFHGSQNTWI